jgi:hypothetical protein
MTLRRMGRGDLTAHGFRSVRATKNGGCDIKTFAFKGYQIFMASIQS